MAEVSKICPHPRAKVIAEWVEPDTVHQGSCFQWFHCEVCGKHWREQRRVPLRRGARLSDVEGEGASGPMPAPPVTEAPRAHVVADTTKLHLGWRSVALVVALQTLVLAAMLWFIFSGAFH